MTERETSAAKPAKVRNAEFVGQLRQALRGSSAYHIIDNLVILLRERDQHGDELDADVLGDILNQLH